jgi:hypothetical protein
MTLLVRLWEKLTGKPHRLDDSARVHRAARHLKESAARLDPLLAIALNFSSEEDDGGEAE